jgi:hypothetical protein
MEPISTEEAAEIQKLKKNTTFQLVIILLLRSAARGDLL